jgi:hypothetical protein
MPADNTESYTPLAMGDVTQLIFVKDSSTTVFSIVGQTRRKDGQRVFTAESKYGSAEPLTSHYFITDGYYVATELEPVGNDPVMLEVNPYREQRLAKSFPEPGDTWLHTPGAADSAYWIAEEIGTFPTLFGKVRDVYEFRLYNAGYRDPFLITYYAKDLGWIGSSGFGFDSSAVQFMCSYKKVSGKTYGVLWPDKDFSGFTLLRSLDARCLSELIFENRRININGEMSAEIQRIP